MGRRIAAITLFAGVLAFMVSPAGAATTVWTADKLTKVVQALVRADEKDNARDKPQGTAISRLGALLTGMGVDVSGLEDFEVYQRALNEGIIESVNSFSEARFGCPHGGYLLSLVSGDSYYVCHGKDGEAGAQGPADDKGNQGERGLDGAPGQNGAPGADGAAGLSAYQLWLAQGNEGTVGDFMSSLRGPKGDAGAQGPKGDTGQQGPKGDTGPQGPGVRRARQGSRTRTSTRCA